MSKSLSKSDVSSLLGDAGLFVLPSAAESITENSDSGILVENILETAEEGETIDCEYVQDVVSDIGRGSDDLVEQPSKQRNSETEGEDTTDLVDKETLNPAECLEKIKKREKQTEDVDKFVDRKDTLSNRYPNWCEKMFSRELIDSVDRVEIDEDYNTGGDVTGNSRGQGEFDDFRRLFEDRFEKMIDLLNNRVKSLHKVSDVRARSHGGEEIVVAGLVWDKFVSKNGNYFIDLEDPNTNNLLRVGWTDDWIKDTFETIVCDEVIAIRGNLSDDGDILWGSSEIESGRPPVMFPDIPRKSSRDSASQTVEVALISDIHVGANEFYPEYWNQFVDYIRRNPQIKYVLVAGDIVEGVGVYPNQDEELNVVDIKDQYAMAGKMFEQLPEDITIFAGVGNHDTVRLAEPQPTLPEKFRKYFPNNVEFVGNPCNVCLHGINFLMYHGMSIYSMSEAIPGLDPANPVPIMELLLKKRHLAPVYGKNVRLAPEEKDYMVIDKVPDVLHCGHVHKYDQSTYNGVKVINTSTWQGQTTFQKSKGIDPDVGYWSVVDLSTLDVKECQVDSEN